MTAEKHAANAINKIKVSKSRPS